jgi:hypothetical protein
MGAGSTLKFGTVHPSSIFITIQPQAMQLIFFINNPDNTAVKIKNNDFSPDEPKKFYIENKGNLSQANNLNNIDFLFTGPAIDNYSLISDSPLIDQGDNLAPVVPFEDLEGISRPANG